MGLERCISEERPGGRSREGDFSNNLREETNDPQVILHKLIHQRQHAFTHVVGGKFGLLSKRPCENDHTGLCEESAPPQSVD